MLFDHNESLMRVMLIILHRWTGAHQNNFQTFEDHVVALIQFWEFSIFQNDMTIIAPVAESSSCLFNVRSMLPPYV